MELAELTDRELTTLLWDATEEQDGRKIKAIKKQFDERIKYE